MMSSKEHAIRMQAKRETWLQAANMTQEIAVYLSPEVSAEMLKLAREFRKNHDELIPRTREVVPR